MFIPEMTRSLTVSNRLGRISLINFDYCLLLKYANDQLELWISVFVSCKMDNKSKISSYIICCTKLDTDQNIHLINCLVYMDFRPLYCVQFLALIIFQRILSK